MPSRGKAFSVSATTANGYSALGPPSGRYFAPIGGPDCIQEFTGSCGFPKNHYVYGPRFVRFDMSLGKRLDITQRINTELRFELLNAFDNVNFFGTTIAANTSGTVQTNYEVTTAYRDPSNTQDPGGRLVQISYRVNW